MKQLNKKSIKKIHVWVRAAIQLMYFLFIPSAYTVAFNGVKYIFTQMGTRAHLEVTSFVAALIVLCVYTIVFGRFFCGFAAPRSRRSTYPEKELFFTSTDILNRAPSCPAVMLSQRTYSPMYSPFTVTSQKRTFGAQSIIPPAILYHI